jgi:CRISPR-associated protein Csx16
MTIWFVTRHHGAKQWAIRQGFHIDQQVEHLDMEQVQSGDHVLGSLPIHLVAALNRKHVRYFHLSLTLPSEMRGIELTADHMEQAGAKLEEYQVKKCNDH